MPSFSPPSVPSSTRRSPTSGRGLDAERIAELCRAAGDYVQRVVGVPIPEGEDSLAFVDHYISVVRGQGHGPGQGQISDEVLTLVAAALGAYLGQVAIAKFGGHWRGPVPGEEATGDVDDPANWRVEISSVPLTFDPVGMAAEALRKGEVEGYSAGMTTVPDFSEALVDALSRNPVEEEYYYSLTGRLETLGYAVELIGEFQRQKQERAERGEPDPGDLDDEDDKAMN